MTTEDAAKKAELIKFEDEMAELFTAGKIHAPVHLSDNNEEQLIGIFKNIKKDDWVFSTHRSHYHALLHGIDPEWLKKEIVEYGNSIYFCDPEHHFYSSGIVGGSTPIALGVALALKLKKSPQKVWVFVGDMAALGGVFHESLQYAERNDLPITFVVEDNGFSTNTPTEKAWGEEKPKGNRVIRYSFEREKYPHYGSGKWVTFG
jgi:pyruvate dehydrogenase E1 component alpha subunit